MFRKFLTITMTAALLLTSFYATQAGSSPMAGPDLVSAATVPTPTPTPTPAPVPAPSAWAKAELQLAVSDGLVISDLMNQYNKPITRLEFTRLIVNLHQVDTGIIAAPAIMYPFQDTASLDIAKAYELGLIKGSSTASFNPNGLLSREEAAVIFQREWMNTHPEYVVPSVGMAFTDSDRIAVWASEAAQFMVSNGLMKGNENNQFEPKGSTTREQAIILMLRSFQKSASITTKGQE